MSETPEIGDTVKAREIKSPEMIVIDITFDNGAPSYHCLWFEDSLHNVLEMPVECIEVVNKAPKREKNHEPEL